MFLKNNLVHVHVAKFEKTQKLSPTKVINK